MNPENLQPKQLQMFMPAKQVQDEYDPHPGDYMYGEGKGDLWRRKLSEAQNPENRRHGGMDESIRDEGVAHPVALFHGSPYGEEGEAQYIANGHHRVAVAASEDQWIPVRHHGTSKYGGTAKAIHDATWADDE